MPNENLAILHTLLDHEREAILAARYDELAHIAAKKITSLERLTFDPPDHKKLKALKEKMADNQNLITAALRGIAAARDRLSALENVRDGLTTYDQSGNMSLVPTPQNRVEKKA